MFDETPCDTCGKPMNDLVAMARCLDKWKPTWNKTPNGGRMDVQTEEKKYTGFMAKMGEEGDTKVMWDKDNAVEVEAAKAQFETLTKKHKYLAFKAEGKDGKKGEQIRTFDPDVERIILVPPMVGG